MALTKTKAAFLLTAESMFEKYPKVYFWTFTFYRVHPDWEASQRFTRFLNHLQKVTDKGWGGLRVAELHKEHGLHFHALVNGRIAIDFVRRVGKCYGIGRVHVCKADVKSAAYLAKYLSKQKRGPKTKTGRNMRRWGAFGNVKQHASRVSDLVNDSPMWVYRREHKLPFLSYGKERVLWLCWERGPEVFKAAWFKLRAAESDDYDDFSQDGFSLALGKLDVKGLGLLAERCPKWAPF